MTGFPNQAGFTSVPTNRFSNAVERTLKGLQERYTPRQVEVGESGLAASLNNLSDAASGFRPAKPDTLSPKTSPIPDDRPFASLTPEDYDRLIKIESGGSYTAENKDTKAYGKYQFLPRVAAAYSARLGFTGDEWKKPENQERMYRLYSNDNIKGLQKKGLPIDAFSMYGAHQQGVKGFSEIMSGNISEERARNIRANLPIPNKHLNGKALADAWISYWKNRVYQ